MRIRLGLLTCWAVCAAGPAAGAPTTYPCALTSLFNYSLAPVDLLLQGPALAGKSVSVTIDPVTGAFTLDGASVTLAPYDFPFSDARDVLDLENTVFQGTIDGGGNINLPNFALSFCTSGTPAGTDCVPGNLCSNDLSLPCVPGNGVGSGCSEGGVCQGVCANSPTTTCAGDSACPGSFCGKGRKVPFRIALTTGVAQFGTAATRGAAFDFGTGTLRLTSVGSTPPESPIVGDTGVSAIFIACTIAGPPAPSSMPRARWALIKARVKLGKAGPGQADDTLTLRGTVAPIGASDFAASGLVLTFAVSKDPDDRPVGLQASVAQQLTIPSGALRGNGTKTKFKLRDKNGSVVVVAPTPITGAKLSHQLQVVKSKGGGFTLTLVSKGLDLDQLGGATLTSVATMGTEAGAETKTATTPNRKGVFGF